MWLVQYKSRWSTMWFTLFNKDKGFHQNVATLVMEKAQKQYPRYEFRMVEKDA